VKDNNYSLEIMKKELNNQYICSEVKYAFECSIEALEKQIPKKIKILDYGKAHCPRCKTDIHGKGKIDYCYCCGQKLDW